MDDIAFRFLITLGLVGTGLLAYAIYSRIAVRLARSKWLGLESAAPGRPTILYFTAPYCLPCRTVQGPAIESVARSHDGDLQVIKIDAQERPEVADHWGVLSLPTVVVLDREGKPRFLNTGVTPAEKLEEQLMEVS